MYLPSSMKISEPRPQLLENDEAIIDDVQKIQKAFVPEEKIHGLLKTAEENRDEEVKKIRSEIPEKICSFSKKRKYFFIYLSSLDTETKEFTEAVQIRMESLEKQIEEFSNDIQSEKKKSENNIALYEESVNDVKTETNEKCKKILHSF